MIRVFGGALAALLLTAGVPFDAKPTGDLGSYVVSVANRTVHPKTVRLATAGSEGRPLTIGRYSQVRYTVNCVEGGSAPPPTLEMTLDRETTEVVVPPVKFETRPPVLWISTETMGRGALERVIRGVDDSLRVRHLSPAGIPGHFSALRYAPIIVMSLIDWSGLAPSVRKVVRDAVAAGVILVVTTGQEGGDPKTLGTVAKVDIGALVQAEPSLRTSLPRVAVRRQLTPREGALTRARAGLGPVVVDSPLGLGVVRIVGTSIVDLDRGPFAEAVFTLDNDALGQALRWTSNGPPPPEGDRTPWGVQVWGVLALLLVSVFVTRRRPLIFVATLGVWIIGAALVAPDAGAERADAARVIFVPFDGGAVAVGTLDLTWSRGGTRPLPVVDGVAAIDAAPLGSACAYNQKDHSAWVMGGEPGARRRLVYVQVIERTPAGEDKLDTLEPGGQGGLAGALLRRISSDIPLPLELRPEMIDAVIVDRVSLVSRSPVILE